MLHSRCWVWVVEGEPGKTEAKKNHKTATRQLAPRDPAPGRFGDRLGLPRQHGLVDEGPPRHHHAVHRHPVPRQHPHPLPHRHRGRRHPRLPPSRVDEARFLHLQLPPGLSLPTQSPPHLEQAHCQAAQEPTRELLGSQLKVRTGRQGVKRTGNDSPQPRNSLHPAPHFRMQQQMLIWRFCTKERSGPSRA